MPGVPERVPVDSAAVGEPKSGFYSDPKGVRAKIRAELRGTHDIAKAAEMLLAEGEIRYWQTPDGDEPVGSFVGAPIDKVAMTTLMNCYEFVHLCDMLTCCSTSHLRTTGVLGALFDKNFKKWDGKEEIPRGSVVVITNSIVGSGPDNLYHAGISVGGGNCVANSSGSNVHKDTVKGEFSVLGVQYGTVYFGPYPHCRCHPPSTTGGQAPAAPVEAPAKAPTAPVATPPPGTGGTGIVGIRVVDADTGEPVEGTLTISGLRDVPTTTQEIPPPKAPHVGDEALRNVVLGFEGTTVTIVHTPPPGYEVVRNSDGQSPSGTIVVTIKDVTYHTFYDRRKKLAGGGGVGGSSPFAKVLAAVAAFIAVAVGIGFLANRGRSGGPEASPASTVASTAAPTTVTPTTLAGPGPPTSPPLVSGRYAGTVRVRDDPAGHACCVHPASAWEVLQTRDTRSGAISIKLGGVVEGIELSAPLEGTGVPFTATGTGTVAGRAGTEVSFTGTVTPQGGVHGVLTVGGNRTLPTGQAITFTVDMAKA